MDTDSRSGEPRRPQKMPKAKGTNRDTAGSIEDLARITVVVKFKDDVYASVIFPITDCLDGDALSFYNCFLKLSSSASLSRAIP